MLPVIRKRSFCRPLSRAGESSLISNPWFCWGSPQGGVPSQASRLGCESLCYRQLSKLVLLTLCVLALLIPQSAVLAQTATQNLSPEAARVDQLITECRQLMAKGSFEGIAEKGEEALKLSQKIGDKLRQSRSLMYIALGMFHTGQTEEAIEPFKQSAALAAEAGDKALQTRALNAAGPLSCKASR